MRRLLAMLLAVALLCSLAIGVSAEENEAAGQLSLEVTQGKGSVTVRVYLENCGGVTNGRFSVGYDAQVLSFASAETTDAYAVDSVNSQEAGSVSLAWVGSELTDEKTLMLTLNLTNADSIAQDMTYTAASEGIYVGTEAAEVAGASVTVAYTAQVDLTELAEAIETAEGLQKRDYTSDSYAAMEEILADAVLVMGNADATQEEVDAAAKALNAAIDALVKVSDGGSDEGSGSTGSDPEDPKTGDDSQILAALGAMLAAVAAIACTVYCAIRFDKEKQVRRIVAMVLVVGMAASLLPMDTFAVVVGEDNVSVSDKLVESLKNTIVNAAGGNAQKVDGSADLKLDQQLSNLMDSMYDDDDLVRIIVELEGAGLLEQGYTDAQIAQGDGRAESDEEKLLKAQKTIAQRIGKVLGSEVQVKYNYTVALNGIALTVPYGKLDEIRKISGVAGAYVVSQYMAPETAETNGDYTTNMYATSQSFGSAQAWNELGYTGKGMTIAIIDTGLDVDHPSFAASPEGGAITLEDVQSVLTELNAYNLFSQTSAVSLTAEKLYYSGKVPFGFNYVDCSVDVTHDFDSQGDHGTHVAGIAAANALDTTDVVGVAPDAQLVIMKVFGQNGGAYSDDILAAIEDCITLGVDVINMSLGAQAGFTEDSYLINEVYGRILQTDMILAVAAGNANSAATGNTLGTNLNYTSDPDIGLVNSPATYLAATTVASLENTAMMMPYFTVGEQKIVYVDVTYFNFAALEGTYSYVVVPGVGDVSDYEGVDVAGKIALVQRGTIDFVSKQQNAYDRGAVALVVYDNVEGDLVSMYDGGYLPNVFISKADGEAMIAAAENGEGKLTIMAYGVETAVSSSVAGQLSDFSCWGVTSDLQLMPDVTAPGGNIYSTYTDGAYGTMSGTSMASPHIAGMAALVLQHLREKYPNLTESEMHTVAEALIMCTAVPVVDPDGILYSPRKQGAGAANVYSAAVSPVYLTSLQAATGELTPKASMGDDPERSGVFTFTFRMNNLTDQDQVYMLAGDLLTDQYVQIDGREYLGETGRNLTGEISFAFLNSAAAPDYDANQDGKTDMDDVQFLLDVANGLQTLDQSLTAKMDLHNDGVINTVDAQLLYELLQEYVQTQNLITVPASGSISVDVTVTLSAEDMAYMQEHYANGIYVDGFVRAYAQSEGAVDLSLPLCGFYGDWHDAPMLDTGWYYEDEETVEYNRYYHVIFATLGTDNAGGLGINPYINEEYDPEHNVLSPNGDTYYDYVPEIYISLLRSAELLDFTWTDAEGNELYYEWYGYARKSYYWSGYGMCMPIIYTDGDCVPYTFYDENGNLMVEDLDHITLTIRGYLDDGDLDDIGYNEDGDPIPNPEDADAVVEIPITIDMTAPTMDISSIEYFTEDGRNYVRFDVEDNYDLAAVVAMTMGGGAYEYVPVTTKTPGVDGEKDTVTLDITDYDATFQIVLCDYGCNETYYVLTNENNSGLADGRFYAYRRYSTYETSDALYTTDQLNGWYSFESADSMTMHTSQASSGEATVFAAEYVDGYIFGAQGSSNGYNTMFVSKAGSWERIALGSEYELRKTVYEWPGRDGTYFPLHLIALDMAYDYTTGTLYMLANALETDNALYFPNGEINILCSVDMTTGQVNVLGKIFAENGDDLLALTLACDNEGVLYTVNYEDGKLYTINKTPAQTTATYGYGSYMATCVNPDSTTKYWPAAYTQSMTVDHNTNTLYWAGYQGTIGQAAFIQMDKATGDVVSMTYTEHNGEMVGLFVPYDSGKDLIPDAQLTGIALNSTELYLNVGQNTTLLASAVPYNAQLGDVVWTTSDASVASVSEYGIVVAEGVGTATITAACGAFSASCQVFVSAVSGTLFAYSDEYWLLMDAGKPFEASQVVDAMEVDGQITAAAYLHGYIYAASVETRYDADGNAIDTTHIYKLNASTLNGELVGSFDGKVTALAFSYADGFMYGLRYTETYEQSYGVYTYELIRLNVNTAEIAVVTDLNELYPFSDYTGKYQVCSGALAIDYDGNFYVSGDNANYEYNLIRFNLDGQDQIANVTEYVGFTAYNWEGDALVWSERNGGLLHVAGDTLQWVDVSDMTAVKTITLGQIRGANGSTFALAIPLTNEPVISYATPESVTLEPVYTVPKGETVKVAPTVNPWNASGEFTYVIEDTSIAVVDSQGVVTGLTEGTTTITVTEMSSGLSASATVEVVKNPGYLYGYFQANLGEQIPLEVWGKISIANPSQFDYVSDLYDLTIYAGTFYDGYLYAMGKHGIDGNLYLLKIDPSNYVYNIMCKVDFLVRGMAFDYTTGTMYAVGSTEVIDGGLYQMDLTTGEMTFIADNDAGVILTTLACTDDGVLYTTDENGSIYTMDKDDAQLHSTGISGSNSQYLQSMTYDFNNDTIYWANGSTLWQLDIDNGVLVNLGSTGCSVSSLFTVPYEAVQVPETVAPNGVAMAEKNTVAVGETLTVKAVVLPVSVATVDQTLTWTSGDETIATVDENGVITGVAPGEVTITATNASGQSDSIHITVTAEHRYFYGYDELSQSWVRFGEDGQILETWADAQGLSPITAAQYINGTLYAYDADGYFYSVDTDTFQRTLLGDGIHGMTASLEAWDKTHNEQVYFVDDIPYRVIDMTYTETVDRKGQLVTEVYAVIMAYHVSTWRDSFSYKVVKVSLTDGKVTRTVVEDKLVDYEMSLRPTNLLYRNGSLWTINGYITGMITKIDPIYCTVTGTAIIPTYWGDFNGGRSLIEDPLTGETYAIRDMRTEYIGVENYTGAYSTSELCTIDLGVANCDAIATIGSNMRIVGLFIK